MFEGKICEPVIFEVSPKDPKYARMVENSLNWAILKVNLAYSPLFSDGFDLSNSDQLIVFERCRLIATLFSSDFRSGESTRL